MQLKQYVGERSVLVQKIEEFSIVPGLNVLELEEIPSNRTGYSMVIESLSESGNTFSILGCQPVIAGQVLVDWNSIYVYIYGFDTPNPESIRITYYGRGNVPKETYWNILHLIAGKMEIQIPGSPQPNKDLVILQYNFGMYTSILSLEFTQLQCNIGVQGNKELRLVFEPINTGLAVDTENSYTWVIDTSKFYPNAVIAESGSYLYKLTPSYPILRIRDGSSEPCNADKIQVWQSIDEV